MFSNLPKQPDPSNTPVPDMVSLDHFDHINRMITQSVITLSGFLCTQFCILLQLIQPIACRLLERITSGMTMDFPHSVDQT
jgi:hypothetical protein